MSGLAIGLSVVLVLLNGAFVASEFAVLGARRAKIDALAAQGRRSAIAAQRLQSDVLIALGGAQLGITVCSLLLGKLGEPAVAHVVESAIGRFVELSDTTLHALGFAIALGIVVVVHMVLGEMVPKNLTLARAERVLLVLAPPMRMYLRVARPVNGLLQMLSSAVLKPLRIELTSEVTEVASAAEIRLMVRESHQQGAIDAEERALIEGALRFGETLAADVMAPFEAVDSVHVDDSVASIEAQIERTSHTRLVFVGDDADDVRGFVHSKDLLTLGEQSREAAVPARMVRPMLRVAPGSPVTEVLQLMRRARIHLALVTAEGVSLGVLTLDDLMRPLVGTLTDAGDS